MRPDASKKLASTAPKGSMNRAIIGAIVAGLAIAGVVVAILVGTSSNAGDTGSASTAQPVGVVGGKGGGILANATPAKSTAPTLEIYADFQCDQCGHFEEVFGAMLATMAQAGDVKLVFHIMSFVDEEREERLLDPVRQRGCLCCRRRQAPGVPLGGLRGAARERGHRLHRRPAHGVRQHRRDHR